MNFLQVSKEKGVHGTEIGGIHKSQKKHLRPAHDGIMIKRKPEGDYEDFYIGDSTVAVNKIGTYPKTGMAQGDLLLIQFGYNDEKPDEARHTEPFGAYSDNPRFFIRTAREKGAHPLLIPPIARRLFDEQGNFCPGSHGDYPAAMGAVGEAEQVPVADLTAITEEYLAQLGDEASKPLFVWPKDNTHLKVEGAVRMAGLLAQEMRRIGGGLRRSSGGNVTRGLPAGQPSVCRRTSAAALVSMRRRRNGFPRGEAVTAQAVTDEEFGRKAVDTGSFPDFLSCSAF